MSKAREYHAAGELGLALVELDQALALDRRDRAAQELQRQVRAEATAVAREAQAQATAAAREPRLDVRVLIGQPASTIRAMFGTPRFTETVRPGTLETAPRGGQAYTYFLDWGAIEFILEDGLVAGLFVYFEGEAKPRSYDEALVALNLPLGRRPSTRAPAAQRWENLDGLFVHLSLDGLRGRVAQAVIRRN